MQEHLRTLQMRELTISLLATLLMTPALAGAILRDDSLPGTTTWYFHVDLKEMRSSDAGKGAYAWLDDEVFEELHDELGVDFDEEINEFTAYGLADSNPIILLQGPISQDSKDKLIAAATLAGEL